MKMGRRLPRRERERVGGRLASIFVGMTMRREEVEGWMEVLEEKRMAVVTSWSEAHNFINSFLIRYFYLSQPHPYTGTIVSSYRPTDVVIWYLGLQGSHMG